MMMVMMMKKEKVGERHEKKPLGKEKTRARHGVFLLYSFTHVLPDDCEASEVGVLGPIFVVAG